ncbi:hypothetical protein PybrP1_013059, partial [[Pythium] brassicae (nom. inval.)]
MHELTGERARRRIRDDQTARIHCGTEDGADTTIEHSGGSATTSSGTPLDDTIIIDAEDVVDTSGKLKDLSKQNSYDLPSSSGGGTGVFVMMCFYGVTGVQYAILTTNELDVVKLTIRPVTLAKAAVNMRLMKVELQAALHFYLTIMRLLCIDVEDAMRDVDIAGEDVWKELSEQNDKGYVAYVQDIPSKSLHHPAEYPPDEWICVPTHATQYTLTNMRLLLKAVTHPSAGHLDLHEVPSTAGGPECGIQSSHQRKTFWNGDYERLKYLGDAIIEYLTLSYAFLRYDTWLSGSLSQWKSATVSDDPLGKTALVCFGVDEWICAGAVGMDRETLDVVARLERKCQRDGAAQQCAAACNSRSLNNYFDVSASASRKKVKATGTNPLSLPNVFETLVAAVFLDSTKGVQTTRDVFLGPLFGLTIERFDTDAGAADQDEIIEPLFSDDDEDVAARGSDVTADCSFEGKVVVMCTPGSGIPGVTDADTLARFVSKTKNMDPRADATTCWQILSKTLALVCALIESATFTPHFLSLFQQHQSLVSLVEKLYRTDHSHIVRESARKTLSLVLTNGANAMHIAKEANGNSTTLASVRKSTAKPPRSPAASTNNNPTTPPPTTIKISVVHSPRQQPHAKTEDQAPVSPKIARAALASWRRRMSQNDVSSAKNSPNLLPFQIPAMVAMNAAAARGGGARSENITTFVSATASASSRDRGGQMSLNFTVKTARLQSLKRQKYQHLQEEALLKARGLLKNWEDGPVLLIEDLYRQAAGRAEADANDDDANELRNYTPEALALRFSLRNDPSILNAVKDLWVIDTGPRDALGCIDQRAYTALFRRIA